MSDNENCSPPNKRTPWNKGKLIGARPPLRPRRRSLRLRTAPPTFVGHSRAFKAQ
jgi:hypothetical protein